MRFLCLHGIGTNSEVLEMQTAAIRYELAGDYHDYDFVNGSHVHPMAPELQSMDISDQEFYSYADTSSASSITQALDELESYIESEGPYDGVMAFSQGSGIAATLMARKMAEDPMGQALKPLFRCAIFFSGIPAADPEALLRNEVEILKREVIEIPTAHIWGSNDDKMYGIDLNNVCKTRTRETFIWNGGHAVPGFKNRDALSGAVEVIRRAIHEASV